MGKLFRSKEGDDRDDTVIVELLFIAVFFSPFLANEFKLACAVRTVAQDLTHAFLHATVLPDCSDRCKQNINEMEQSSPQTKSASSCKDFSFFVCLALLHQARHWPSRTKTLR